MSSGGSSSKPVVHNELKKNLVEANHKIIALQSELSSTKDKLSQSRINHEDALVQVRDEKGILMATIKSMEALKTDYQQVIDAKNSYSSELDSIKLCNQTLISKLQECQKSYKAAELELKSYRSRKEKCNSCEKKPFNNNSNNNNNRSVNNSNYIPENQNFQTKYFDLQKQHRDLLTKEQILEKKFVELTLKVNSSSSIAEASNTTPYFYHLEKQLADTKTRENRLLTDVSKLKQIKDRVIKEKRYLQDKYNATNMQLKKVQFDKETWLAEIKALQEKLKASDGSIALLQEIKSNWENENRSMQEKLKFSMENIKKLQELKQKYVSENLVLREKVTVSEQMMKAFQENELLVSKEIDVSNTLLASANFECDRLKISNDVLKSEIVVLKDQLAVATRPWF